MEKCYTSSVQIHPKVHSRTPKMFLHSAALSLKAPSNHVSTRLVFFKELLNGLALKVVLDIVRNAGFLSIPT